MFNPAYIEKVPPGKIDIGERLKQCDGRLDKKDPIILGQIPRDMVASPPCVMFPRIRSYDNDIM